MKISKIKISKINKDLKKYEADISVIELVKSNINLYNDMVDLYNSGATSVGYKMYQLNIAITNQLNNIKKTALKRNNNNNKNNNKKNKVQKLLDNVNQVKKEAES